MLVLSRKPGERIVIGDDVVVEVVHVRGKTIRLGITAPKDTEISRDELLIDADPDAETRQAAGAVAAVLQPDTAATKKKAA